MRRDFVNRGCWCGLGRRRDERTRSSGRRAPAKGLDALLARNLFHRWRIRISVRLVLCRGRGAAELAVTNGLGSLAGRDGVSNNPLFAGSDSGFERPGKIIEGTSSSWVAKSSGEWIDNLPREATEPLGSDNSLGHRDLRYIAGLMCCER